MTQFLFDVVLSVIVLMIFPTLRTIVFAGIIGFAVSIYYLSFVMDGTNVKMSLIQIVVSTMFATIFYVFILATSVIVSLYRAINRILPF